MLSLAVSEMFIDKHSILDNLHHDPTVISDHINAERNLDSHFCDQLHYDDSEI